MSKGFPLHPRVPTGPWISGPQGRQRPGRLLMAGSAVLKRSEHPVPWGRLKPDVRLPTPRMWRVVRIPCGPTSLQVLTASCGWEIRIRVGTDTHERSGQGSLQLLLHRSCSDGVRAPCLVADAVLAPDDTSDPKERPVVGRPTTGAERQRNSPAIRCTNRLTIIPRYCIMSELS